MGIRDRSLAGGLLWPHPRAWSRRLHGESPYARQHRKGREATIRGPCPKMRGHRPRFHLGESLSGAHHLPRYVSSSPQRDGA